MNKIKDTLFLYLDESGDLGKLGSKFFIIAILANHNKLELERCIKRLRQRKLKKSLKELGEIKANNSTKEVREYLLKCLSKTNSKLYIIALDKSKVYDYLYEAKEKLYNYISGLLMENIELNNKNIELIVDRKSVKTIINNDFNFYITNKFRDMKWNINIKIEHKNSENVAGLMAVDFVAWTVNRKFAYNDDSYYKIIEHNIASLKKIF